MSFGFKTKGSVGLDGDDGDDKSLASYLLSNGVANSSAVKHENADCDNDSGDEEDLDGENESGDEDESGDEKCSGGEHDSDEEDVSSDDDEDSDDDTFNDGVQDGTDTIKVKDETNNDVKVKDEPVDSDFVLKFIKQEKFEENEDKYKPDYDQLQRDGAQPGDSFSRVSSACSGLADGNTDDIKKVSSTCSG